MNAVETREATAPPRTAGRRRDVSVDELVAGVRAGDRALLARAITCIESDAPAHQARARELLERLLPFAGGAIRIGITGVPGAGKSTFIEALGLHACSRGHRTAVLAVDPSSPISRGSVLGDKTRMENLARHPSVFIRPSPSAGVPGGIARRTRETMLVCEAAGFDVVLVETVGVGQGEVAVRSMVDFFLLLVLTGAGDDLQGIKRGILELADAVLVNKADGENRIRAEAARRELERVLHLLRPATEGWPVRVRTCSARTGEGVPETWAMIEAFVRETRASGAFGARRGQQAVAWMQARVEEGINALLWRDPAMAAERRRLEEEVLAGRLDPSSAAERIVGWFERSLGP